MHSNISNPTAPQFADYLHSYAEHFQLFPYIRLGVDIKRIQRSGDGQAWEVVSRSRAMQKGAATEKDEDGNESAGDDGKDMIERYERLLVCTGPWTAPFAPNYPGREEYRGTILLSREYKKYVLTATLPSDVYAARTAMAS